MYLRKCMGLQSDDRFHKFSLSLAVLCHSRAHAPGASFFPPRAGTERPALISSEGVIHVARSHLMKTDYPTILPFQTYPPNLGRLVRATSACRRHHQIEVCRGEMGGGVSL